MDRSSYRLILSEQALVDTVQAIKTAGVLSFDLETTSLNTLDAEIVGFALAWAPNQAAYVPVGHDYPGAPTQLTLDDVNKHIEPLLRDAALPKVAQNVKYEIKCLHRILGYSIEGMASDTMLASYLLDPGRRQVGLNELAIDVLGHKMLTFKEVTGGDNSDGAFARVSLDIAAQYAAEDADITLRLHQAVAPKVEEEQLGSLLRDVELPLAQVIAGMETAGILLDTDVLQMQSDACGVRIRELTDEIHGARRRSV